MLLLSLEASNEAMVLAPSITSIMLGCLTNSCFVVLDYFGEEHVEATSVLG